MIPQIASALSSGFTSRQIVDFLIKQFPQHSDKIKSALSTGYSAEHVLKFLSGGKKALAQEGFPTARTEYEETRSRDIKGSEDRNRMANIVGAGAVMAPMAASALSSAAPAARAALGRAAPQLFGQGAIPGAQQPAPPALPQPVNPSVQSPISQQQQALPQPELKSINALDVLQKNKFAEKVESLLKAGNTPEQVDQFYRELNPTTVTQIEKEAGKPFKDIVEEYAQSKIPQQVPEQEEDKLGFKKAFGTLGEGSFSNQLYDGIFKALQEGKDTFSGVKDSLLQAAKPAYDAGQIKTVEDLKRFADFWNKSKKQPPEELPPTSEGEWPKKPKYPPAPKGGGLLSKKGIEETFSKANPATKGAIVETPDGIGEVREIRNGKALVEVDGKMRKMLEEELMSPGLPQKDLADLHDELIEGIKTQTGKEVSRHVEWAGYDPEHKELVYRPWGDKEYVYDNIDPEDVDMLTNLLTQRKTTGENYIGSWEAGTESPIGAAMHALITKVRNKAKESGQEKAHKRRYEAVYSAYEPAQKASKQKKDAEKKRLKDEEKRRKAKEKQALQHSRSPSRVS